MSLVPVVGRELTPDALAEMEAWTASGDSKCDSEIEAKTALTEHEVETAATVGEMILDQCPYVEDLKQTVGGLSQGARDLLDQVLLTCPQTPLEVIYKLEDRSTLVQTLEFKSWFRGLPTHLKCWIMGDPWQ